MTQTGLTPIEEQPLHYEEYFQSMNTQRQRPSFEIGPIRPPSEGGSHSLLIRPTRNCPWSRCRFCYAFMYERRKFELRKVEDIKKDIDAVKIISDHIRDVSFKLGYAGEVNQRVVSALVQEDPGIQFDECFVMVLNWLHAGAKTVFLQDANSLIMPTGQLLEVIQTLKETFPSINRITTYARAKTVTKKSMEDLVALRETGLSRLHVGLETGDEELLKDMDKGATPAEQILAGQKAKEAGFELSEYVMLDLGGRARFRQHAENTAKVLNQIDPHFIRLRPLTLRHGIPLMEEYERGDFQLSSPHERLEELKILVSNLEITGRLCFDHFMNGWHRNHSRSQLLFSQDYNGYQFPKQKDQVLALIDLGLQVDESAHLHYRDVMAMEHL